ncbi:VI protein [Vibrio phage VFJ]|uniref:Head virion protein G6P n=3 Tax=root TaxID=1 RepID=R9TIT8_9VIRU|nr:VI protein [Vibrio phage VFJ]AGN30002.1 VI protein [Vibrio phage VFJ]
MAMPVFLLPIITGITGALRIPAIAAFLATLAANILSWFSERFTRAVAINLTVLTMVIGLALAAASAMYALAAGLAEITPPYVVDAWGMFVPSNAIPCVATIFSAKVIRWVWGWQFYVITKMSS